MAANSAKRRSDFLIGFALGYALREHEATKELRRLGDEFEERADAVRAEAAKIIADTRAELGLPPARPADIGSQSQH
jgi:hypothetical protein